jgi:hypothetical protein
MFLLGYIKIIKPRSQNKMPVITRSQSKKNCVNAAKHTFISDVHKLLCACSVAEGKENKMRVALEIFEYINQKLPEVVKRDGNESWGNFAAAVFNKTTEMLDDAFQGNWFYVDKTLAKQFSAELHKSRDITTCLIKNNPRSSSNPQVMEAAKLENTRPRRNIARVDYRGMDTMEPEF